MGRGGRRWKPFLSVANSSITLCRPSIRNGNSAGLGVSTTMNRIENANFAASQRGKRISIRILEKVFIGIVDQRQGPCFSRLSVYSRERYFYRTIRANRFVTCFHFRSFIIYDTRAKSILLYIIH